MTVRVSNFNIGRTGTGTGVGASSFSDPMNQPAGPLDPTKWTQGIIAITPLVTPVSYSSFSLNGTNGTCLMQGTAAPNTQLYNFACPTIIQGAVYGKSQFSQITFRGATGVANNQWGPAVAFLPSAMPVMYWLRFINSGPNLDLMRFALNGNGAPGASLNAAFIVTPVNANVLNVGDVMRLSVDFTVPSAPIVTVKLNGSQVASFTDNVAPLSGGLPSMIASMHDGNYTFNNWSCGVGL